LTLQRLAEDVLLQQHHRVRRPLAVGGQNEWPAMVLIRDVPMKGFLHVGEGEIHRRARVVQTLQRGLTVVGRENAAAPVEGAGLV
jgi:hypothetical protein